MMNWMKLAPNWALFWLLMLSVLSVGAFTPEDDPMRPNRLEMVKKQQIEAAAEAGEPNPYVGVDMASGPDSTVIHTGKSGDLLAQMQAAMAVDLQRIKTSTSVDEKAEIKAQLLPNYLGYVQNYRQQGQDTPNDVAVRVMVWLFDTGQVEQALELGFYLVASGNQLMPSNFNRTPEVFIADAMYDWANDELKAQRTATPYLDDLVLTMTDDSWDMPAMVISKNLAMLAKHKFREGDFVQCLALCDRAETANPTGAGVKTMKKDAAKALAKKTAATTAANA